MLSVIVLGVLEILDPEMRDGEQEHSSCKGDTSWIWDLDVGYILEDGEDDLGMLALMLHRGRVSMKVKDVRGMIMDWIAMLMRTRILLS